MAPSAFFGGSKNRTGVIFMASFFCLMTIVIVLSRFYARRLTRVGLGIDDWLALVALAFVLGLNGIFIAGSVEGAITRHSLINSDNRPMTSDLEHTAQKYKYAFQITEKLAFGLIKLSLIFLWKRLFGPAKYFTRLCWIMIAITSGWSLLFFFATIFECGINWAWNWAPIASFLNQCANTPIRLCVFTGMDLLTDLIIMCMPVPLIWGLRMPIRKKMSVTSIFVLGLFTIGTGAARMYFYIVTAYDMDDNPDFLSNFTLFILWSDIEANVAMVVCCMPTLTPVLGSYYSGLTSLISRINPNKWPSPSSSHFASKPSNINLKPPITLEITLLPLVKFPHDGVSWQDAPRVITQASYGAAEAQNVQNKEGILARTEIHRTFEPREGFF